MVWPERTGDDPGLSYEAFLAIARQEGIDTADGEHLALLYEDVRGMLETIAEMAAMEVGSTEPSTRVMPIWSPSRDRRTQPPASASSP